MSAPVIETDRLVLRAHTAHDFEPLAAMWGDAEVARFIGGKPSTRDESWARLLRYAGHWALMGFGFWAVTLKDGGRFIGDVGFADWRRDITPSLEGLAEGGWVFTPEAQGRGLATEAVQAALHWMDGQAGHATTTCIIGPGNTASIRLAGKVGYREFARAQFKGAEVIQYRRDRPAV